MTKKQHTFLWIIFAIALLAMLGSLYFSSFGDPLEDLTNWTLFQGAWLAACSLCRWGRILMYPIVLLSWLGLLRKNKEYIVPTFVLSTIGIYLAAYHYLIQFITVPRNTTCAIGVPCDIIDWSLFTYITLPGLELVAFAIVSFLSWRFLKQNRINKK